MHDGVVGRSEVAGGKHLTCIFVSGWVPQPLRPQLRRLVRIREKWAFWAPGAAFTARRWRNARGTPSQKRLNVIRFRFWCPKKGQRASRVPAGGANRSHFLQVVTTRWLTRRLEGWRWKAFQLGMRVPPPWMEIHNWLVGSVLKYSYTYD